jgi:hypothetical protein
MRTHDRLEALLDEKLSLVEKVGAASKGFAATQMRTDAYRQVRGGGQGRCVNTVTRGHVRACRPLQLYPTKVIHSLLHLDTNTMVL